MTSTTFFGSDPEFFIKDLMNEDYLIPPAYFRLVHGIEFEYGAGDTQMRHPIFGIKDFITIHEDGAALEMTVPPSRYSFEVFAKIQEGLLFADSIFSNFSEYGGLSPVPAMKYDWERYNSFGAEMIMANRAGCDPDRDIDNENQNEPLDMTEHPWRYAGGHLHVSTNDEEIVQRLSYKEGLNPFSTELIALFSTTVGLCNIAFSKHPDLEVIRQFRFGKPGKWRYQVYAGGFVGVEYRTPSASWVTDEELAGKLFTLMEICFKMATDDDKKKQVLSYRQDAKTVILSGNQQHAKALYNNVEKIL